MDSLEKMLLRIAGLRKTPMGKVNPDLLYEHQKVEAAQRELAEKIKKRIQDLQEKMRQDLHAEFDPLIDQTTSLRNMVWEKTYSEMGIAPPDRKARYSIDRETGEMFKVENLTPGGLDDGPGILH